MSKLDKDIEQRLRRRVESYGGKCLKWVCPGWAGVPDRIVLLPRGRIYFVETKKPKGGQLSALQKQWRKWITGLGFPYWVVWNEDDPLLFELSVLN